jgi:hypothetical protein
MDGVPFSPQAVIAMDDAFNPYYAFLGLDEEVTSPNHYQLLRLKPGEADPAKIAAAADKAATRVRGHRPGENVVPWSMLLDEIQAARTCLLDPAQRAAYEAGLESPAPADPSPQMAARPANPAAFVAPTNPAPAFAPAMTFVPPPQQNFAYPPGAAPAAGPPGYPGAGYQAPTPYYPSYPNPAAPYPNPAMPVYPQQGYGYAPAVQPGAWNPAQPPAGDPMAPMAMPGPGGPMAPVGYSWSTMPPAGPALAPPVAPVNPNTFDPMAPVAYPAKPEPPTAYGPPENRIVGFAGGSSPPTPEADAESAVPTALPAASAGVHAVPVGQAVVKVAELGLPATPVSARGTAKRPEKLPMPLLIGGGGAVFLLAALLIAWSMMGGRSDKELANNAKSGHVEPEKPSPEPEVPRPQSERPRPQPERSKPMVPPPDEPDPEMTRPTPKSEPEKPVPSPEPSKPEPTKPEPAKPESTKPEPTPKPTAAELGDLSTLMKDAKTALGSFAFEDAEEALEKALKLAKLPEHRAKVLRLKNVAELAKKFRQAIVATMTKLEASEVIKVGTSTEAIVVESSPQKLVMRVAGQNKTYTVDDLPLGLAANLGERSLNADDPSTKVLKGAYVIIDRRADPSQIKKAKTWWEEAQLNGVDISTLLPVLTDKYDFEGDSKPD